MLPTILSTFLFAALGGTGPATDDARTLIETIETLQQPIEDFRCEYEGTLRFKGAVAESQKGKLGEDGLYDTFSGIFIWKRGGDTYSDSLHRMGGDGRLEREGLVVCPRERQAEQYRRPNDAEVGYVVVKNPKEVAATGPDRLGSIFLIDELKRIVADGGYDVSVEDDQAEGRPLKVLNLSLKNVPDRLLARYWIDLRRNGHVVRQETYARDKAVSGRLDIKLDQFKVGDGEVWMPVSGAGAGYMALVDKKPVVVKEPTSLNTINVLRATMEFNKKFGPEVFTLKYKPGTPITDELRKLQTEYGRQKIAPRPTKAEAEKMLNEQVAKAQEQKAELVAAPTPDGSGWWPWTVSGMGVLVVISLVALWIQRQGR